MTSALFIIHQALKKSGIFSGVTLLVQWFCLHVWQFPSWFIPQLWHSCKYLHTLQCKFNKNPSTNSHQRLFKAQQSFHADNIAAKSTYLQNLIHNFVTSKDSYPKIFHFIKEFTKTHVLPSQLHADSTSAETDVDKA